MCAEGALSTKEEWAGWVTSDKESEPSVAENAQCDKGGWSQDRSSGRDGGSA